MTLSIVIVNYHSEELIKNCTASLKEHLKDCDYEIIVVNNGSFFNEEQLSFLLPENTKLIPLLTNKGFSFANNAGVRVAVGKYVLLLNPDTFVIDNSIQKMIEFAEANEDKKIGVISCRLMNPDKSFQLNSHWGAASWKKLLQQNPIFISLFSDKIKAREKQNSFTLQQKSSQMKWVSGAVMLIKRSLFVEQNLWMDEDFFMYFEDVEFCERIRMNGFQVLYLFEPGIVHIGGSGESVPLKRFEQLTISEWLCIMKRDGKPLFILYMLFLLLNQLIDAVLFIRLSMAGRIRTAHLRQTVLRKRILNLHSRYFLKILMLYRSKPSSAKEQLRYV